MLFFYRIEDLRLFYERPGKAYTPKTESVVSISMWRFFFHTLVIFFLSIPTCTNTVSTTSPRRLHSFREFLTPWMHIISHLEKCQYKSKLYLFSKMFATNHDWLVLYVTSIGTIMKVMLALIFTEVKSLWCITPSKPAMTKFAHEINPN